MRKGKAWFRVLEEGVEGSGVREGWQEAALAQP